MALRRISLLRPPSAVIDAKRGRTGGYVPNVVYTCGAPIHNDHLYLPYAMFDSATGFAIVPLNKLLERLAE